MKVRRWVIAMLLAVLEGSSRALRASAEEPSATVVVTAEPLSETQARAPTSFATVIDTTEHGDRMETTADVLGESVGVQVRRFGGLGAFSTISIRGSSPNQVQFYLDGVPLSRAVNETVNVSDLPLDGLERIEVYRGTVPIGFSGGGLGGVVNLVTKQPTATPATDVAVSYGSFSTRKVVAEHSQQWHGIDLLGHVTYLGSQGDFTFLDNNGTPLNPYDDRRTTRRNNAFNSVDAILKGGGMVADGVHLDLTSETFFKDQGVPGIGNNQSLSASLDNLRTLNYLRLTAPERFGHAFDLTGALFGSYERSDFSDPNGDLGTGNQQRHDQTTLVGGSGIGTYYGLPNHALGTFIELSDQRFAPSNALATPSDEPDQTRLQASLSVQDQATFLDGRVIVVPTVGYQHLADSTSATFSPSGVPSGPSETHNRELWNPSIGAQLQAVPAVALRGNFGRFERAPTFSELFGNRGAVIGNPSLQPETGTSGDVGLVADIPAQGWLDGLHGEFDYFNRDVNDLIVLVQNSQRVSRPVNIGAANVSGEELTVHGLALHHVSLDLNYTHQAAVNESPIPSQRGKQLPGRPANELYTQVELFTPFGKLYYELSLVSGNFLDPVNFTEVPSRDVHTLGVSWNAAARLTLSFEAQNITDNQISDVGGFPLPGRTFFGTVTAKF
jgi:outer membrane cobalamin receptor